MAPRPALITGTAGILPDLPDGWGEAVLGDVGEIHTGSPVPKGEEYFVNGTLPFITPRDIGRIGRTTLLVETENLLNVTVADKLRRFPKGTILFPNGGGSLLANNRAITGSEAAIEKHVTAIIPNSQWNTLYIYYCLCNIDMKDYIKNPSYASISLNDVKVIPIPKPPDLAIQYQIVSRLEVSLSMLNASRQTLDQMLQDAQFVMRSALKEVIEQLDRSYPNSPSLGRLIANRTLITIGGSTPSEDDRTGSIPWVKSQDMKKWYISDSQEHISSLALEKGSIKLVPTGSVLVTRRSGVLAHTLPIAITTKAVTINQDMIALQITGNLIPEYLGYILRAREEQLLRQITSSPQKGLPLKALESVIIPDISLNLQKKIVTYLDSIQEKTNTIDEILKQDKQIFDQVEKSLLERAFRGDI